jgi:penicillin amidase
MIAVALALLAFQTDQPVLQRDGYGVPIIKAASLDQAFFHAGKAVAEDRLWQMELSRRVARGRMAEALGSQYTNADKESWTQGYTDAELRSQFEALEPQTRAAFQAYVRGVNDHIQAASKDGKLPEGYASAGLTPEPWTVEDSVAITVLLMRQFGRFGAGELRNLALLTYLEGQVKVIDRKLDVLDDLIWQNDPKAIPTVLPEDDTSGARPTIFPAFDRKTTESQVAKLPKLNLLELSAGLRIASRVETKRVAQLATAPHKAGSYAIVVGKSRSGTGQPLLLSGPQMGFTNPSIVHEIVIDCPEYKAAGMGVPGVPGVAVGATPFFAWGLTSGVADTDDIFFYKAEGTDGYSYGSETKSLQKMPREVKVKGGAAVEAVQTRTLHGPVVLKGGGHYFVRRAATWMNEAKSLDSLIALGSAKSVADVDAAMKKATANFNFFFATKSGDVGYRYAGHIPMRASGLDPRLPTPGAAENEWKGFVPYEQMPKVTNPKGGLIANWNNKPVSWWPNGDSPVWGRVFRNSDLLDGLQEKKLTVADLENAIHRVARREETYSHFASYLPAVPDGNEVQANLTAYDGWTLEGSLPAGTYTKWQDELRKELFVPTTGNFISPDLFKLAVGPVVMLNALEGRTKVDYLAGRSAKSVAEKALANLSSQNGSAWAFQSGKIRFQPNEQPVPYRNRGTYIQILELAPWGVSGRNVLPPGQAESGDHAWDQVSLARNWTYKPMYRWPD